MSTEWQDRAACAEDPYNGFTEWDASDQVALCLQCPVRAECGFYGYRVGAGGIVYGGRQITRKYALAEQVAPIGVAA